MSVRAVRSMLRPAVLVAGATFPACSSPDVGKGNTQVDDTRPATRPPPAPMSGDAEDAGLDARADAAAAPACDRCACTPDAHYCFGGDDATHASASRDASAPACPLVDGDRGDARDGGTLPATGCHALPAECAASPTCACVLAALQPSTPCYLVCSHPGTEIHVTCPHP